MVKKKKILSATKEDESYFVSLNNPLELRRHLLESSRKTIYTLQSYQKILLLRERKIKELTALRQSLKELVYLNKKFNEKLPPFDTNLIPDSKKVSKATESAFQKTVKDAKKVIAQEKPVEKNTPIREKTDLEKLEESLNSIEKKLSRLDNN